MVDDAHFFCFLIILFQEKPQGLSQKEILEILHVFDHLPNQTKFLLKVIQVCSRTYLPFQFLLILYQNHFLCLLLRQHLHVVSQHDLLACYLQVWGKFRKFLLLTIYEDSTLYHGDR
jgi:hypothetical protein